jgi:hypothetical protein
MRNIKRNEKKNMGFIKRKLDKSVPFWFQRHRNSRVPQIQPLLETAEKHIAEEAKAPRNNTTDAKSESFCNEE